MTPKRDYYPAYMRRKRHPKTAEQMNNADGIRQMLQELANTPNYVIQFFTTAKGKTKARIGRADGVGLGFVVSRDLAQDIINYLAEPVL